MAGTHYRTSLACVREDDAYHTDFVGHCRRGLETLGPVIARRVISPSHMPGNGAFAVALERYLAMPARTQKQVVTLPMYGYWWHRLTILCGSGDACAVGQWARHLSRFIIWPQVRDGHPVPETVVPVGTDRTLTIAGWRLRPLAPAGCETGIVSYDGDALHIRFGDQEASFAAPWLDPARMPAGPPPASALITQQTGTDVLVDPADAWLAEYVDKANANTKAQGGRGDVRPAPLDTASQRALDVSLCRLHDAWPAMFAEFSALVRVLLPFASAEIASFSNGAVTGVLFVRNDLADLTFTVERIVHETSHLRLGEILALNPAHVHGPHARVPSPYRKSERPVDGLIHGLFVFMRIAWLHLRLCALGDQRPHLHRVGQVLAMQRAALNIVDTSVTLTPFGAGLVAEIREATENLEIDLGISAGKTT
jgi:HEXXH motif-containing protein